MGKGDKPRIGHSLKKFAKAYDGINWGKKEEACDTSSANKKPPVNKKK